MPKSIAIIDYGAGNLRSIQKALAHVAANTASGLTVELTADPQVVERADAVVLPGVGAAGATMRHLEQQELLDPLRRAAMGPRPFLGICLGLQLLFEHHGEDDCAGLGVLPGQVNRLPGGVKVPHMGWNNVTTTTAEMFGPVAGRPYFYFVHSYYAAPAAELAGAVVGTTHHGVTFCSALVYRNIWATQFHPEKSGRAGLELLARFAARVAA
ncbi:MAG TPA: imidazole glycerol phosphate synthase subunit HisH [Chloroflexia bacterium]|nr:imidazole glycerol phosphate synthase subunit HisH [Chloroflexia bacterium]